MSTKYFKIKLYRFIQTYKAEFGMYRTIADVFRGVCCCSFCGDGGICCSFCDGSWFVEGSEFDINAVVIARSTSQSCVERYWRAVSVESICVNSWNRKILYNIMD